MEIETATDANVNPETLADKALEIWRATEGAKDTTAAFGFAQERRGWQVSPMNMGGGFMVEPKAEGS